MPATLNDTDARIRRAVLNRVLRPMLHLRRTTVRVTTTGGVVTLRGHTELRSSVDRMVRMAGRVPGVTGVEAHFSCDVEDTGRVPYSCP